MLAFARDKAETFPMPNEFAAGDRVMVYMPTTTRPVQRFEKDEPVWRTGKIVKYRDADAENVFGDGNIVLLPRPNPRVVDRNGFYWVRLDGSLGQTYCIAQVGDMRAI